MTSFAFILGLVPLAFGAGAGAELRQALGTAVFFGMIGVPSFGLLFTPAFYVSCQGLSERFGKRRSKGEGGDAKADKPSSGGGGRDGGGSGGDRPRLPAPPDRPLLPAPGMA